MTKRNTRAAFIKRTPSPPPQLTPATWRAISMDELKSFNEKRLAKARDAHDFVAACEQVAPLAEYGTEHTDKEERELVSLAAYYPRHACTPSLFD